MFREKVKSRGARGIIGLRRVFKIVDDDRSGTLSFYEFHKVINDYRIVMNQEEAQRLFNLFDIDGNGEIDYDEFLRGVAGPMNQFRTGFVRKAYSKLDKDRSGILDIEDIKGTYNAKNHPDVKAGKKTEEEVLGEFLDTFEMHHSLKVSLLTEEP